MPRHCFIRFSLRALLLLVVAICMALGWTMHKVRQQGLAVAALEKLGRSVQYRYDGEFGPRPTPTLLERVRKLLGEAEWRNAAALAATNADNLPPLSDADLVHLGGIATLHSLNLDNTQITDAGLVHLGGLPELESLSLENTQITDAGLVHLQGLTKLGELWIRGTRVTQAGVRQFHKALPKVNIIRWKIW